MTSTNSRILDEIAKMMGDAAGAAQGVKREVEGVMRAQVERLIADMDLVNREDFEILRALAIRTSEENAALRDRITALESVAGDKKPSIRRRPKAKSASGGKT